MSVGVEIYPFVEVDWDEGDRPFAKADGVRAFNLGEYFIWRSGGNLDFFYALVYGTCDRCRPLEMGGWNGPPLFPPRGLPSHLGSGVLGRYFHVVDKLGYAEIYDPALPTIDPEKADRYVTEQGSSHGPPLVLSRGRGSESLPRVSCPTWHCASWLGFEELGKALAHHGIGLEGLKADVRAMIAVMRTFEEALGPGRTRLVYWFDNAPT